MKARGKNIELVATLKSTFATDYWRCNNIMSKYRS